MSSFSFDSVASVETAPAAAFSFDTSLPVTRAARPMQKAAWSSAAGVYRFSGVSLLALLTSVATSSKAAEPASDKALQSWAVEEVVVTGRKPTYAQQEAISATKTPTPLQQTPQAIVILNRTLLDEQDRRTLSDALVNVSGVTPAKPEETVLEDPIVRGFPAEIYVDGLPAYGGTPIVDPSSLINVERIEVAKGPTSTLYGGGLGAPLGGLIDLVSKSPSASPSAEIEFRGGSFSTFGGAGDVNGRVTANGRVLARLTGEYVSSGSPITDVRSEKWSIYPTLDFVLTDRTDLIIRGQFSRNSQLEYAGLPAALTIAGPVLADRYHFSGASDAPHTTIENNLVTGQLTHRFSDAVEGRISARYYDSRFDEYAAFTYPAFYPPSPKTPTQYALLTGYLPTTSREVTVDANLQVKTSTWGVDHLILAGVAYDKTDYHAALGFNFNPIGVIDYADPTSKVAFGAIPTLGSFQTDAYFNAAVYVQDQATVGGRLHFLGSLRFTDLGLRQHELGLDKHYERLTPRVGATFDISSALALFAGYSEGFRAVPNFNGSEPPKPETSQNIEAGLKLAARSIGLSGTIAAYQLTRQNVSTTDPGNPFLSVQTGEQRARGFEVDTIWEPTPALSILANGAYTDAEVTRDTTLSLGSLLPRVPKTSGRIAGRYRILSGGLKGLSFGAGVTAMSRRQTTLPNSYAAPGYAVADAQIGYDFKTYTVALAIANLTNTRAFDPYQYLGQSVVIPTQPRSAYVTIKARF